jgi:hypothetical protein
MIYFKFALLLLQIVKVFADKFVRDEAIKEGERRQFSRELAALARAAQVSKEVRDEVDRMTDDEIDDALRGDFRP